MYKEFTKDMLVSGKHVVKFKNGRMGIYVGFGIMDLNGTATYPMNRYSDCLTYDDDSEDVHGLTILEIYEYLRQFNFPSLENAYNGAKDNLIWKREQEPTEAEKQLQEAKKLLKEAHLAIELAELAIVTEQTK